MGGNFSIRKDVALRLGGFDQNFVRVAYRFEAEFARRYTSDGRQIWFDPRACLHHLKEHDGEPAASGGIYDLASRPLRGSVLLRLAHRRPSRISGQALPCRCDTLPLAPSLVDTRHFAGGEASGRLACSCAAPGAWNKRRKKTPYDPAHNWAVAGGRPSDHAGLAAGAGHVRL